MTFLKNTFSLILFLMPLTIFSQDSIDLSLRFIPNDTFTYQFKSEPAKDGYGINDDEVTRIYELDFFVKKVSTNGTANIETTFARQIYKMGYGRNMVMFDTNYPDTTNEYFNKVGYSYMEQIGYKNAYLMFPNQDMQLADASNIEKNVAPNSHSTTGVSTQLHLLNFHPNHSVKIGDTWSKTFFELFVDQQVDYQFTLESENDTAYVVKVDGKISSKGSLSAPVDMFHQTVQIKQNLFGTEKGYIEVDKKTGWVTRLFINQIKSGFFTMYNVDVPNDDGYIRPVNTQKNIDIERVK